MKRGVTAVLWILLLTGCQTVEEEDNRLTSVEKYYINHEFIYLLIVERIVVNTTHTEIFMLGSIGGTNRVYRPRLSLGSTDKQLEDNHEYIFRERIFETTLKKVKDTFYITRMNNGENILLEDITLTEISADRLITIEEELRDRMTNR